MENKVIIEFPQIHSYALDKKNNHLYFEIFDDISETSYIILFDTYEFIDWIDTDKINEMKKSLIKKIENK